MSVGLVIVSHSAKIAEGVVELAAQMAPSVTMVAAGGTDDSGIGTSFDKISGAIAEAESSDGVLILCDLGSAILTAETAIDFLDDEERSRVVIADAPLVEGAVAAAVTAEMGASLQAVAAAAETANSVSSAAHESAAMPETQPESTSAAAADAPPVRAQAVLINPSGLHARPAAEFVKMAGDFDARVTLNGIDAKSLLSIMGLGLGVGTTVTLEASGPDAARAVESLVSLIESGFGE
ncbi:MAG TPA: dihydroxyacetone kinase phosphoryl donor subunit DhaM [Glaciihabitans sp.]|jgi:PTS hybrid protein|nr:dihydroxyacetone kinase phosphoryl donor subunit DhaM [Glaciihabitans sp.]